MEKTAIRMRDGQLEEEREREGEGERDGEKGDLIREVSSFQGNLQLHAYSGVNGF